MADVLDLPPEPLPRDERRRDKMDDRRRDRDPRDRRGDDRDDRRRDYHDRRSDDDRPGSAVGRDRGRDYKRRRSPSSPSYMYRDRDRRGSPARRSPSSYKRIRRDDYDDRRGGSPRNGMDDRHDRRIGRGRSNSYSGDERAHGRHPDTGRGGYDMAYYDSAPRREGLMTYKQFISELEDDVSPSEAERRYEEYKNEFISTQKKAYFEQNKHEDWLREKYDPSCLEAVIQRRNEACKVAASEFMTELESGSLDTSPSFIGNSMQEGHASGDDAEDTRRRRNGRGPAKEQDTDTAPKVPAISSEPRRIARDIEQARALVRKLDSEKGIERNILTGDFDKSEGEKALSSGGMNPIVIVRGSNQVKGYEGVELLDVVLTYLWRIHYVDYYGSLEFKEQPKALRHVRTEGKTNEDSALSSEWEKKVDSTWQARLQGQDPLERMLAKEKVEAATAQALEPLVRKIKDEKYGWKYGCGAKNCTKLFHGPEFVHKHLKLKHPELVSELAVKVQEELYFENYMSDPDAPGSTPVMASQNDRARRLKRPGTVEEAGGRSARDLDRGRGSGRESNKPDRVQDDDRNDREDSPSRDYQAGAPFDGPFEGRSDPMIFDPYGGPGMRGLPPFGGDMGMPPPVLMPVPGAGPLGPFVPAPPEVAMRLWREQGGAGPFHPGMYDGPFDGEGSRGSRKRSGPPGGGILPFPTLRQDSRRALRSYRDLDAPEDEVTVIDYRSL